MVYFLIAIFVFILVCLAFIAINPLKFFGKETVHKIVFLEQPLSGEEIASLLKKVVEDLRKNQTFSLQSSIIIPRDYYRTCPLGHEKDTNSWSVWHPKEQFRDVFYSYYSCRFKRSWSIRLEIFQVGYVVVRSVDKRLFDDGVKYDKMNLICSPSIVKAPWNKKHIKKQLELINLIESLVRRDSK